MQYTILYTTNSHRPSPPDTSEDTTVKVMIGGFLCSTDYLSNARPTHQHVAQCCANFHLSFRCTHSLVCLGYLWILRNQKILKKKKSWSAGYTASYTKLNTKIDVIPRSPFKFRLYFLQTNPLPTNTIHWANVGLILGHRLRRRPNIKPALAQCIVFAGLPQFPHTKWWFDYNIHVYYLTWEHRTCLLYCDGLYHFFFKIGHVVRIDMTRELKRLKTLTYFLYEPWRPNGFFNLKSS